MCIECQKQEQQDQYRRNSTIERARNKRCYRRNHESDDDMPN